jgi:hypothetical protein
MTKSTVPKMVIGSPPMRTYYYGIKYSSMKLVPFLIRKKEGEPPPDAIIIREAEGHPHALTEEAKKLCQNFLYESRVITELPQNGDVSIGDVATHEDGEGIHFAIVLDIYVQNVKWADVLFFSSKNFGRRYRRATKEEIALAGFVETKPTFLCFVSRPVDDFYPRGIKFPEHRVEDLRNEFLK